MALVVTAILVTRKSKSLLGTFSKIKKAQKLSKTFLSGLTKIINEGIDNNEIKKNTDASQKAQLILSIIEGSSLLAFTHNDNSFLTNTMDYIDKDIIKAMEH